MGSEEERVKLTVTVTIEPKRPVPSLVITIRNERGALVGEQAIPLDQLQTAMNAARKSSQLIIHAREMPN